MSIYQLSNLGNKPKEMVFSSQLKSYNNLVSRLNSSFIKTKTCQSVLKTLARGIIYLSSNADRLKVAVSYLIRLFFVQKKTG